MNKKVLVIAAHPDDEVLGCGGTIARLAKEGCEVFTVILGEGITSRDEKRDRDRRKNEVSLLKDHIKKANEILGVKDLFCFDFPDNRFDSVDLIDIVKVIEKVKNHIKPEIIFTHDINDLNIDHKITYQAVLTATRPVKGEVVKGVYTFEILSSTEWSFNQFVPNIYYDIADFLDFKLKAMGIYTSELREFPHPRSLDGIRIKAKQRGMEVGFEFAEAFRCVRLINR